MSDTIGEPFREPDTRRRLTSAFRRVVAMLLLIGGLSRAGEILGMTMDGSDFSDLSTAWRAAATTLVFVDLFAAVGLWIEATWGPVMWAVALVVEVAMYTVFSDMFGESTWRVLAHIAVFLAFLVLSFLDWRRSISE